MARCPTCDQPVAGKISFDFNKVFVRGRKYFLTPSMVSMLTVLHRKFPDGATTDELAQGIWGAIKSGPPLTYTHIIQHYANMMRMILQDHLKIVNEYGGNYRMVWRDEV